MLSLNLAQVWYENKNGLWFGNLKHGKATRKYELKRRKQTDSQMIQIVSDQATTPTFQTRGAIKHEARILCEVSLDSYVSSAR